MKINDTEVTVGSFWTTKDRDYFYEVTDIVEGDTFPIKTKLCDFYGNNIKSYEYTFKSNGCYMSDQSSGFDIGGRWYPEKVLRLGEIWESTKGEQWKVVKVHIDFSIPIECVCLNVPEGTEPFNEVRFLYYGEWKYNGNSPCDDPGNLVKLLSTTVEGTKLVELTEDVYYEQIEEVIQVDNPWEEVTQSEEVAEQVAYYDPWKEVNEEVQEPSDDILDELVENITDSALIKEAAKSNGIKLVDKLFKCVRNSMTDTDPTEVINSKLVILKEINTLKHHMEDLYGH